MQESAAVNDWWILAVGVITISSLSVFTLFVVFYANYRLRRQQRLTNMVLDASAALIVMLDKQGRILSFNKACERTTGYNRSEVLNKYISNLNLIPAEALDSQMRAINNNQTNLLSTARNIINTPDGKSHAIEWQFSRDMLGEDEVLIVSGLDMTERQKAEDQVVEYKDELRKMASELSLAEERERRNIAEELHDSIGQTLAMSNLKIGGLKKNTSDPKIVKPLSEFHQMIQKLIKSVRSLIFQLSPPILYEFGFESATEWLAEQMTKQNKIPISFSTDPQEKPLSEDMAVMLYKAVRELLMNIGKHSKASEASIQLARKKDHLYITVKDNGVGFDPDRKYYKENATGGFGLFNMKDRLDYHNAKVDIESLPGKGSTFIIRAPLSIDYST